MNLTFEILARTGCAVVVAVAVLEGCACNQVPGCKTGGPCASYDDYCSQIDDALRCSQAQACGVAATDVSCAQVRPWPASGPSLPCPGPLGGAIDAGLIIFNGGAAGEALQQLRTHCGATLGLRSIFQGTLAPGKACNGLECVAGSFCNESAPSGDQCGSCQVQSGNGTSVSSPTACATDTVSWSPDAGFVCTNFIGDGGACDPTQITCAAGLSCQSTAGATSACLPVLALGAACSDDLACGFGLCRGSPPRCVSRAKRGEACAAQADPMLPLCLLGYACVPSATGVNVCDDRIPVGGSCVTDSNGCVTDAICNASNVCVALGTRGMICNTARDCDEGLVCNSGPNCDKPNGPGDPCITAQDCGAGLYCNQATCTWDPCIP